MIRLPARIRQRVSLQPGWPSLALLAWLVVIGTVTLVPDPSLVELAASTPVWCLVCGSMGTIDVLWNVLLFVPLGASARWNGWSPKKSIFLGIAVSCTIEALQATVLPGRDASLSDLVTNSSGTLLGVYAFGWRPLVLQPTPQQSRRFLVGGLVMWLATTGVMAWGFAPHVSTGTYFGQWAPSFRHLGQFRGDILEATVAGLPLAQGPFARSSDVQSRLGHADTLWARIRTAAPPTDPAPIVSLADDRPTTLLRLSQAGRDLVYHSHTRLGQLKMRDPAVVLRQAFPSRAGVELEVAGGRTARTLSVWRIDGAGLRLTTVRVSPHWSWYAIFPVDVTLGRATVLVTGLWLCLLMVPLGFWTTRTAAQGSALIWWTALVVGLLVGAVAVPLVAGLDTTAPIEWAGVLVGIGLGALISRRQALTLVRGAARNPSPIQTATPD
jgi:hypothetical protein